jgi:hypothetical protein
LVTVEMDTANRRAQGFFSGLTNAYCLFLCSAYSRIALLTVRHNAAVGATATCPSDFADCHWYMLSCEGGAMASYKSTRVILLVRSDVPAQKRKAGMRLSERNVTSERVGSI